ncbi:hypothetical protein GIB67_004864 [Kingdonia uniflora]|uniref:Tetratricopeptide repeat protein n=1 Tax=Kingdonia uniflora TaxID=39325 RepID=A0A7J7LNE8_9MAGN|nr:hypothetical protein GIB67_004864 [Kingdonia uniflora]
MLIVLLVSTGRDILYYLPYEMILACLPDSSGRDTFKALNNLGSVYVDYGKLDQAENCYMNALNIRHTRAHQGLARVNHLKNLKTEAYDEMTKLIDKARNNASAYEKCSEYCERDTTNCDLSKATHLDPLRTYPCRYSAAVQLGLKARDATKDAHANTIPDKD